MRLRRYVWPGARLLAAVLVTLPLWKHAMRLVGSGDIDELRVGCLVIWCTAVSWVWGLTSWCRPK